MASCGNPVTGSRPAVICFAPTLSVFAFRAPKRPAEKMVKSQGIGTIPSPLPQPPAFIFDPGVRNWTQISLRKKGCCRFPGLIRSCAPARFDMACEGETTHAPTPPPVGRGLDVFARSVGMCQFTVSEKVAVCWAEPAVAVTVTVDVTGGGSITMGEAAPQPLSRLSPAMLTANSISICQRRRLFHPKQQSATARADPRRKT